MKFWIHFTRAFILIENPERREWIEVNLTFAVQIVFKKRMHKRIKLKKLLERKHALGLPPCCSKYNNFPSTGYNKEIFYEAPMYFHEVLEKE